MDPEKLDALTTWLCEGLHQHFNIEPGHASPYDFDQRGTDTIMLHDLMSGADIELRLVVTRESASI